jgi:GWxTD domain-containing protein
MGRRVVKTLTCLLLLALAVPASATGVESLNMARSRFFIDHAVFAGENTNRLEVYYKVFNDGLNYVKKGDKYVANYEINVIILGDRDKQVTGQSVDKTYVLDDYSLTRSQEGFLINEIDLNLHPGKYALLCKLIDHNSNTVSSIESKFETPKFDSEGDISGIEFIQKTQDENVDSKFVRDGYTAVPVVERVYDSEDQDLGFFAEVYPGRYQGEPLTLYCDIVGDHNGVVLSDTVNVDASAGTVGVREFLPLAKVSPGDYDLVLKLQNGKKKIAERKSDFIVKWSLASLIKNDFDYAVEQLKYVISDDEKKELYEAPDSMRLQKFEEWWASKDPSPTTEENELREEYYRRIRYSDQYFGTINHEGWQTDRGMIYIRYGEPDQIDRHPFEIDRKPYQIWYYYGQRRTFVFEDSRGDGDYQLAYPYDGDWSRYIGP